jgi:hypothetical protein
LTSKLSSVNCTTCKYMVASDRYNWNAVRRSLQSAVSFVSSGRNISGSAQNISKPMTIPMFKLTTDVCWTGLYMVFAFSYVTYYSISPQKSKEAPFRSFRV